MSVMLENPPITIQPRVTAEELLSRPDGNQFELVNGELGCQATPDFYCDLIVASRFVRRTSHDQ